MSGSFKDYWSTSVWNKKSILDKLYMFSIANLIVIPLSLIFFFWLKDQYGCPYGENGFIYIDITWNAGISFSNLKDNLVAIYIIQSFASIAVFTIAFFAQKKSFLLFIYIIFLGGMFNLLQRPFSDGKVLDYFHFGFWKNFAIFNVPDMMVVTAGFGLIVNVIISMFLWKEDKNVKK